MSVSKSTMRCYTTVTLQQLQMEYDGMCGDRVSQVSVSLTPSPSVYFILANYDKELGRKEEYMKDRN